MRTGPLAYNGHGGTVRVPVAFAAAIECVPSSLLAALASTSVKVHGWNVSATDKSNNANQRRATKLFIHEPVGVRYSTLEIQVPRFGS